MTARDGALKPYQRSAILVRPFALLEARLEEFAQLIAQEGGKPLTDARVEATRAVDGLRNAAEEIRNFAGREVPMGPPLASDGRWASPPRSPLASSPQSLVEKNGAGQIGWQISDAGGKPRRR